MTKTEIIGVVGADGNLGSKLRDAVRNADLGAFCYDIASPNSENGDPETWTSSLGQIVEKCTIIHWCAPSRTTRTLTELQDGQVLILHDSVMYSSELSAARLKAVPDFAGSIAIVHCLMNQDRTVAVNSGSDEIERVREHITRLGLNPVIIETGEHDTIMAESQAPFAVLHELLIEKLRGYDKRKLLTPSGQALHVALEDRSASWTAEPLRSIFSNPQLAGLLRDITELAEKLRKTNGS